MGGRRKGKDKVGRSAVRGDRRRRRRGRRTAKMVRERGEGRKVVGARESKRRA